METVNIVIIVLLVLILYKFIPRMCRLVVKSSSNNKMRIMNSGSNSVVIYRFYRPTCIHCKNMQAEWDEFLKQSKSHNVVVNDIDMNTASIEHQDLFRQFQGQGVPHIVRVKGNSFNVHQGERTASAFLKFALEENIQ